MLVFYVILEAGPPSREELGRSLGGAREELGRSLGEPGRGPGCGRGRPEEVWREGGRGGARRPSGEVRPGSPAPVSDLTGGGDRPELSEERFDWGV